MAAQALISVWCGKWGQASWTGLLTCGSAVILGVSVRIELNYWGI